MKLLYGPEHLGEIFGYTLVHHFRAICKGSCRVNFVRIAYLCSNSRSILAKQSRDLGRLFPFDDLQGWLSLGQGTRKPVFYQLYCLYKQTESKLEFLLIYLPYFQASMHWNSMHSIYSTSFQNSAKDCM